MSMVSTPADSNNSNPRVLSLREGAHLASDSESTPDHNLDEAHARYEKKKAEFSANNSDKKAVGKE